MRVILLGFVLFLSACQLPSLPEKKAGPQTFFSLEKYFNTEVSRLSKQKKRFKKHIKTDAEEEDLMLHIKDWKSELELFKKSDINKPSWADAYSIDSIKKDNKLVRLDYKALKEDLFTQRVSIDFSNKKVQRIEIENFSDNAIYHLEQTLSYSPEKGYKIIKKQKVLLFSEENHSIELSFGK